MVMIHASFSHAVSRRGVSVIVHSGQRDAVDGSVRWVKRGRNAETLYGRGGIGVLGHLPTPQCARRVLSVALERVLPETVTERDTPYTRTTKRRAYDAFARVSTGRLTEDQRAHRRDGGCPLSNSV